MPAELGIRELKNRASEIVRAVRESGAEYVITLHGKPVARLVPLAPEEASQEAWAELDRLAQEIAADWQSERSALELLDEARR